MLVRQNQQQFRNANADVQLFYRNSTWNKPPGVSQVYMLLVGGGGNGNTSTGGSSGAVTTWWGAAKNVPDSLVVNVSTGSGVDTIVNYQSSNGLNVLLTAPASALNVTASAMSSNQFAATGFFQSVPGLTSNGGTAGSFVCGGSDTGGSVTGAYGYVSTYNGYFLLSPIIVGVGGSAGQARGGIGCGGNLVGLGGPGLVIIASW